MKVLLGYEFCLRILDPALQLSYLYIPSVESFQHFDILCSFSRIISGGWDYGIRCRKCQSLSREFLDFGYKNHLRLSVATS